MTPADIRNKRFDKTMSGYKIEEVHQFLAQVADYVSELEQDSAELQEKMEVLAEKLEQYREDEDSLRAALIGAQKLGQSVVREAQQKAEGIMAQAVQKAEALVGDAQTNLDKEVFMLQKMQRDAATFKEKLIALYTKQLEMIRSASGDEFITAVEYAQIQYTPPKMETINLQDLEDGAEVENEPVPVAVDEASKKKDEAKDDPKRRRFGQLNQFFGEDKPVERQ